MSELNKALDGEVELLPGHPDDDDGDEGESPPGDRLRLLKEDESESIGLKH
jgi:hypothetical protein